MKGESTTAAEVGLRYISKYSAYDNFLNTIRNEITKTTYTTYLKLYLNFSQLFSYDQLLELDNNITFNLLRDFIIYT